jgi:membrane fusion protein, copper/silver efflux system
MRPAIRIALLITVGLASFFAGRGWKQNPASNVGNGQVRKILYYQDPMHPAYKSDKPGIAPDCGMQLVPVYADGGSGDGASSPVQPPGTVLITPEKQQVIGVRIGEAEESTGTRVLRTVGRVVPDETRLYRLVSPLDGLTEDVAPYAVGSFIKKDDLLLGINNPEFIALEQSYLSALATESRGKLVSGGPQQALNNRNLDLAVASIRNDWISERQMKELQSTRKASQLLKVYSPVSGCVLVRNISPGQTITRGTELFRIADLSHIWVLADLFEDEADSLRPGQRVRVSLPRDRRAYTARVSDALPQIDPVSRTFKVRLELDNPTYLLRPDMFVDVEVSIKLPAGVTVPVEAVVDSGLTKTVFVDLGNGLFEPRAVQTGWRNNDRVQILKGIKAGERIVISGAFLVDSESHLKAVTVAMSPEISKDPVCGMEIDRTKAAAAGSEAEFRGKMYFFCSAKCKGDFQKDPEKYISPTERKKPGGRTEKARVPAGGNPPPKVHEAS